jgi:hypothetical protein
MLLSDQCASSSFCLRDIAQLLRKLIGHHHDDLYEKDMDVRTENDEVFSKPFRELFLWSVLMNR